MESDSSKRMPQQEAVALTQSDMVDMLFLAQGMGVCVSRGDIASAFVKRDELEGRLRAAGFDAKVVLSDLAGRCFATSRSIKNPNKE